MRFTLFMLAVIGLLVATADADIIRLIDGRTYTGRLVSDDGQTVVFEVQKYGVAAEMHFVKRDVASIDRDDKQPPTAAQPETSEGGSETTSPQTPKTVDGNTTSTPTPPAVGTPGENRPPTLSELFTIYAQVRGTSLKPADIPPLEKLQPMSSEGDEEFYNKLYGKRVDSMLKEGDPNGQLSLAQELARGARLTGDRPGLGQRMVFAGLELVGKSGRNQRPMFEALRRILVDQSDKANPLHIRSWLEYDLRAWELMNTASAEPQNLEVREIYYKLAVQDAVLMTQLYLQYGYVGQIEPPLAQMISRLNPEPRPGEPRISYGTPRPISRALLAAEGLRKLDERVRELNQVLKDHPDDENANKQMGLLRLVYYGDVESAKLHFAQVKAEEWATLAQAAKPDNADRALYLIAEGLMSLAKAGLGGEAAGIIHPDQLRVKARYYFREFLNLNKGTGDDRLMANLRINELESVIREGSGEVSLFGIAAPAGTAKVVYVVDNSQAASDAFNFVQAELIRSINRLRPTQQFQVILCNAHEADELPVDGSKHLHTGIGANKIEAEHWINLQVPSSSGGVVRIDSALSLALRYFGGEGSAAIYVVVAGEMNRAGNQVGNIARNANVKLFVLALGSTNKSIQAIADTAKVSVNVISNRDMAEKY